MSKQIGPQPGHYCAFDHKVWFEQGLRDAPTECVSYVNQREYGDQLEGEWFESDDTTLTIYSGSFGNYNSPGASSYTYADVYETEEEYRAALDKWEAKPEYIETDEEDETYNEPDEPEEGDYITEDHRNFYQYGKLVVTVGDDESALEAVEAHMEANKFWPSVWFISDHGNAHRMDG